MLSSIQNLYSNNKIVNCLILFVVVMGIIPAVNLADAQDFDPLTNLPYWEDDDFHEHWVAARNRGTSWPDDLELPNCPSTVTDAMRPESGFTDETYPFLVSRFHPGGVYDFRTTEELNKKRSIRSGQQCVYDNQEKLITGGAAAGTPDLVAPAVDKFLNVGEGINLSWTYEETIITEHGQADMVPWVVLGWELYAKYWPPNNGNGAPQNEITPIAFQQFGLPSDPREPLIIRLPNATAGESYDYTVSVSVRQPASKPLDFTLDGGTLPNGLQIERSEYGDLRIFGIPDQAISDWVYTFTVRATDSANQLYRDYTGSQVFSLAVLPQTPVTPAQSGPVEVEPGEFICLMAYGDTISYTLPEGYLLNLQTRALAVTDPNDAEMMAEVLALVCKGFQFSFYGTEGDVIQISATSTAFDISGMSLSIKWGEGISDYQSYSSHELNPRGLGPITLEHTGLYSIEVFYPSSVIIDYGGPFNNAAYDLTLSLQRFTYTSVLCDNGVTFPSQLQVGTQAYDGFASFDGAAAYDQLQSPPFQTVFTLQYGEFYDVLEGPICRVSTEGGSEIVRAYWRLRNKDGLIGWAPEGGLYVGTDRPQYDLRPYSPVPLISVSPEIIPTESEPAPATLIPTNESTIGSTATPLLSATSEPTTATSFAEAPTNESCPGLPPSHMVIGEGGHVTPGSANNLRNNPSRNAQTIGQIPAGGQFTVLAGPVCADGFAWWQVNYQGQIGWTVEGDANEYWIEPLVSNQSEPSGCVVVFEDTTNRRSGPGTSYSVVAESTPGQQLEIVGYSVSTSNFTWWKLSDNSWVRSDVVTTQGDCTNVPLVE